jgi:hypothetical protein
MKTRKRTIGAQIPPVDESEIGFLALPEQSSGDQRAVSIYQMRYALNYHCEPICPYCGSTTHAAYRDHKALACWQCKGPMTITKETSAVFPITREVGPDGFPLLPPAPQDLIDRLNKALGCKQYETPKD